MPNQTRVCGPGPDERSVRTEAGEVLRVPGDWVLVPPGDAGLTRRVKAAGATWTVRERVGRKWFSRGVWSPGRVVEAARAELAAERATPGYARRRAADAQRRERVQAEYVGDFERAVLAYLAFPVRYGEIAARLAAAVTAHATPVGSGTVARTERIPVEERAAAAVIAWMRHRTTAYDDMAIPRVKGKRREVRRTLAERSRQLLEGYRRGRAVDAGACPLARALGEGDREDASEGAAAFEGRG
jgi:hypothetical protein